MQIYLAATPEETRSAAAHNRPLAHVAYRIGPDSSLLRQNLLVQTRGGLLSVSDRDAPEIMDIEALCAAVLRECGRRSYTGVLLDFEERPRQDRTRFAARLGELLSANRKTLYAPETYGAASPQSVTLICTAISGGSFSERLEEAAAARGGAGRLALDVQRLRMDFCLPAKTGRGEPLSPKAFRQLMEQESPAVFFSSDLCARYFTYSKNGETHFVLFDDAGTLAKKVQLGASMGFSAAFFMWPEVKDIAKELFR